MNDNLSIGKDIEVSEQALTSECATVPPTQVLEPTLTEYRLDGNQLITTKIYLNSKDQSHISEFCLNELAENPLTYQEELMDEFLSIGRTYQAVEYPTIGVGEKDGEYKGLWDGENTDDTCEDVREMTLADLDPIDYEIEPVRFEDYDFSDGIEPQNELDLKAYDFSEDMPIEHCSLDAYDFSQSHFDSDELNHCDEQDEFNPEDIKDKVIFNHSTQDEVTSEDLAQKESTQAQARDINQDTKQRTYQRDERYLGRGLDGDIPRHEQPREKALRLGIDALSDAELLALIFGTGIKGQNVLEMSRQILADNMNHLSQLARLSPQELTLRYKGIGQAKAIMLCAAMALGIRAERDAHYNQMQQIDSSLKAYHLLRPQLQWLEHEEFWVIFLTKSNNLKNCCCISRGGIAETVVDVRMVIQRALQESASSMILVHNHPGSLLVPSLQDDELTVKISEAARFFDIQVLDHIIIGASGYYSFKEHNHLRF